MRVMMTASVDGMKSASAGQMSWLLEGVGVGTVDDAGWIRVTGADRVRWLNGMVTNSIQELKPGDGNYSFVLNAQGRIQGDLWTFVDEDGTLLVETARDRVAGLMAWFDRFIIMDEVELEDVSPSRAGFAVAGPSAGEMLAGMGWHAGASVRTMVGEVEVIRGYGPLVERFEVWTAAENGGKLEGALTRAASGRGGGAVDAGALEGLRMLEGTPRFGVDIREKELAQETGQTRALHFAKGCYLGQEIVERIRSRGAVHRAFGGFRLDGPMPAVGAALDSAGKAVGELTSVAAIPVAGGVMQVGLGYARREALGPGTRLAYVTEDGPGWATPVRLPVRLNGIAGEDLGITTD